MAEVRHGYLTVAEGIHIPYQWSYATAVARNAATGFVATDVGKLCVQTDTYALYILSAVTPTWTAVAGAGAAGMATDTMWANKGDLVYASANDTGAILGIGTDNYYLKVATDLPAWEALDISDDTSPTLGGALAAATYSVTNLGAVTLGSATANAGALTLIQGAVASDPTFSITQATNDVVIDQTIGKLSITAASDIILKPSGDADDYLTIQTLTNVPTIFGTGAYTRFGDAAFTSHALAAEDDVMVSGKLEVDGTAYFDGSTYLTSTWLASGSLLTLGAASIIATNTTNDNYAIFQARDNGVGYVDIGRLQSAADPYWLFGRDDSGVTADAVTDGVVFQMGAGAGNEAAGQGFGLSVKLGNSASEVEERASLDWTLANATNGTEDSNFIIKLMNDGAMATAATFDGDNLGLTVVGPMYAGHGIADNQVLVVDDAAAAATNYAKFTADGLQGVDFAQLYTDLSLGTMSTETATNYMAKALYTAHYSLITSSAAATPVEILHGTDGQVLTVQADSSLAWENPGAGTNVATDLIWNAEGDIAYATGNHTAGVLAHGAEGTVLTVSGGIPAWAAAGAGDLKADGTIPLTANWDVGAFTITGTQFISDIATGTAPFVVSSTTVVANLNAATVNGHADTAFINVDLLTAHGSIIYASGANTPVELLHGTDNQFLRTASDGSISWATVTGSVAADAIWDAVGDLAVGSGPDTAIHLHIGTDNQVLRVATNTPAWEDEFDVTVPETQALGDAAATGAAATAARRDHKHGMPSTIALTSLATQAANTALANATAGAAAPTAVALAEQTLLGRLTGANIAAIAMGIADNNIVQIDDADAANGEYVKFTAAGIEGITAANVALALDGLIQLDNLAAPDDNTDLNASTTTHGLLLKATAPAAGLYNYVGITNGETAYTNRALFDATSPADISTAVSATGSAAVAARRDHVHGLADNAVTLGKLATQAANSVLANATAGVTTPTAVTMAVQTVLGRLTGLNIDDIAIGMADDNIVQVDGAVNPPADNDFAYWTASGLEGMNATQVEAILGLNTMAYEVATDYVLHTAGGDMGSVLITTADNTVGRVLHGTAGQVLTTQGHGALPTWTTVTGSVATDAIWTAAGQIVYASTADLAVALPIGTDGQVLTVSATGFPAWEDPGVVTTFDGLSDVVITAAAQGDVVYHNGTNWVNLGHGYSGETLTSAGHGANVVWGTGFDFLVRSSTAVKAGSYVCDGSIH